MHKIPHLRPLRRIIGQNLHAARVRRKMTLRKLSRLTGISEDRLDHFELGKNEMKLDELLKLVYALGVKITLPME